MKKIMMIMSTLLLLMALSAPAFAAETDTVPQEFPFTVVLTDADGNVLEGEYEYTGTKSGTIQSGDTIYLGDADYIDILNLPEGTQYFVTEGETEGWQLDSSWNTSGTIVDQKLSHAEFVNKEVRIGPSLPVTGGPGTIMFSAAGFLLIAGATVLYAKKRYLI